jgi:hypothetical protein
MIRSNWVLPTLIACLFLASLSFATDCPLKLLNYYYHTSRRKGRLTYISINFNCFFFLFSLFNFYFTVYCFFLSISLSLSHYSIFDTKAFIIYRNSSISWREEKRRFLSLWGYLKNEVPFVRLFLSIVLLPSVRRLHRISISISLSLPSPGKRKDCFLNMLLPPRSTLRRGWNTYRYSSDTYRLCSARRYILSCYNYPISYETNNIAYSTHLLLPTSLSLPMQPVYCVPLSFFVWE